MKSKAHYNPKSTTWIISLVVMLVVAVAVVFGSKAIYNFANQKYTQPVDVGFVVTHSKPMALDENDLGITSIEEGFTQDGEHVAYIVTGEVVGYNAESPIVMQTVFSKDGQLVVSVEIFEQHETEYLGVRIAQDEFKNQFSGRYLPVVASGSTDKGSTIDVIAKSTISSQAVIDGVNNAKTYCDSFVISD